MIFNVTIDTEDFKLWEEDFDFHAAFKDEIQINVFRKFKEQVGKDVEKRIFEAVKLQYAQSFEKVMWEFIKTSFESGELKVGNISAKDFVLDSVKNNGGYNILVTDGLQKVAKEHVTSLIGRYDLQYASFIVKAMAKQGLLKDGAGIDLGEKPSK